MERYNYQLALIMAGVLGALSLRASATEQQLPWTFTDIHGKLHQPFEDDSVVAIVLVFIATDCPIANSYQPKLRRLAEHYEDRGIRMFLVHPHPHLEDDRARQHAKEFDIKTPIVIDKKLEITKRAGATVTPQAFVFARDVPEPIYQGRIDNLYANYGKKRRTATTDELADALEALTTGHDIKVSTTKSIGCIIPGTKAKSP